MNWMELHFNGTIIIEKYFINNVNGLPMLFYKYEGHFNGELGYFVWLWRYSPGKMYWGYELRHNLK